jgi:hypothetical protein
MAVLHESDDEVSFKNVYCPIDIRKYRYIISILIFIMSEETTTAVELLERIGVTVKTIANNLQANRLDRKSIQTLLFDYSARASSDGRLINASRQDPNCVNRGLFLAYTHMELISWLAKNNYTILSTSIKWYSWRKVYSKYRLPLLSVSSHASDLRSQMKHIQRTAELVHADLEANNVKLSLNIKAIV